MWFQDAISKAFQYALGQAGSPYVMPVDQQGVPLASNAGALNTFETAAMGYDPSTGRTPVEATNNVYYKAGNVSEAIKAAPGFVHSISCSAKWAGAATGDTEINVSLYDATSQTNMVWGKRVQGTAVNGATYANFDIVLDGIFATGIWIQVTRIDGSGAAFTSCYTTVTYR